MLIRIGRIFELYLQYLDIFIITSHPTIRVAVRTKGTDFCFGELVHFRSGHILPGSLIEFHHWNWEMYMTSECCLCNKLGSSLKRIFGFFFLNISFETSYKDKEFDLTVSKVVLLNSKYMEQFNKVILNSSTATE